MRHVYTRFIFGILWIAVAFISFSPLFVLVGGIFLYSAYTTWKKEKEHKGEQ